MDAPGASGPATVLSNAEIADRLESLAQLLSAQRENLYKVKAYRRAAAKVRTLSESLDDLVREGADLTAMPRSPRPFGRLYSRARSRNWQSFVARRRRSCPVSALIRGSTRQNSRGSFDGSLSPNIRAGLEYTGPRTWRPSHEETSHQSLFIDSHHQCCIFFRPSACSHAGAAQRQSQGPECPGDPVRFRAESSEAPGRPLPWRRHRSGHQFQGPHFRLHTQPGDATV